MTKRSILFILVNTSLLLAFCRPEPQSLSVETPPKLSDRQLFDKVQEAAFRYFWDFGHPVSGLAPERTKTPEVVTSGGSGFGISAIVVATERGWIKRDEAVARLLTMAKFLEKADRFHGAWSHWLDGKTGKAIPFSQKDNGGDLVETSYLVNGLLIAQQYFTQNNPAETELRDRIQKLWETVEWDWYVHDGLLHWHWSPNYEWAMNMPIRGYNECLITYVLAVASPTHGINPDVYQKTWKTSPNYLNGKAYLGYTLPLGFPYGGPLFFTHYSYLGLDPRQVQDNVTNYWNLNVKHTLINRAYCVYEAPKEHQYSAENWGLTASDDFNFYGAHQPTEDNSTISPTAALSAFPYTPYYSMQAMRFFYNELGDRLWKEYGFTDAFSLKKNWFSPQYLAIDQGPIVIMMENYRTGLCWDLFMKLPVVKTALSKMRLDQVNYPTGFHLAIPNVKTGQYDVLKHPHLDQYPIHVYLNQAGPVNLDLLKPDGTVAKRIVSGKSMPAGAQRLTFDAPVGQYQLRLKAPDQTTTLAVTLH